MAESNSDILSLLEEMAPIMLDQMSSIKLMNRIDTKFVTSRRLLLELLRRVQDKYFVQEINGDRISPYRTTYFDTPRYEQYMQHHNRHANRTKVRVRTYLSSGDLTFLEVKKKNERVSVNPTTGIRMLVPPKLVLTYKPSSLLKEKLK